MDNAHFEGFLALFSCKSGAGTAGSFKLIKVALKLTEFWNNKAPLPFLKKTNTQSLEHKLQ